MTKRELLIAAEAARTFPVGEARAWLVAVGSEEGITDELKAAHLLTTMPGLYRHG